MNNGKKVVIIIVMIFLASLVFASCSFVNKLNNRINEYCDQKLYYGITKGIKESILEAVDEGADINKIEGLSGDDAIPLWLAYNSFHPEQIPLLLSLGADPNIVNSQGITPLMFAAYNGDPQTVKLYIDFGTDINAVDKDGDTVLEYAVDGRFPGDITLEIVELLLESGLEVHKNTLEQALKGCEYIPGVDEKDGNGQYELIRVLLNKSIEKGYKTGLSDNKVYAILGKTDLLIENIEKGNIKEKEVKTILFYSAAFGSSETLELLADNYPLIEFRDSNGRTLLHIASMFGNLDCMKYLIAYGFDIEARDGNNEKAIILASRHGQFESTKFLIDMGANLSTYGNDGTYLKDDNEKRFVFSKDVLLEAVKSGELDIVKVIIEELGELTEEHKFRIAKLACDYDDVIILRYILDMDFDVEYTTENSLLYYCDIEEAKILIEEYGANVNGYNNEGAPLCHASYRNPELVEYLIGCGASLNGIESKYALNRAIIEGEKDIVDLLINAGANPVESFDDDDGVTAFYIAASQPSVNILEKILDVGIDVNYVEKNGETALISATKHGIIDNVKMLLKYGALVDIADDNGKTAIDYARESKDNELLRLFIQE